MTTPTFNKFKSTTIYGNLNNLDYPDNSVQASAYFQRNLTVSGDVTCSGIINGKQLYYDNVDISSTFVSNTTLNTLSTHINDYYAPLIQPLLRGNIDLAVIDNIFNNLYTFSISNNSGNITMNTYNGTLPIKIKASNLQLSKNNGLNYYDVVTTNTLTSSLSPYALTSSLSSYALTSSLSSYALTSSLSSYALTSGATFTGDVIGLTALSTDNTTKFATTAFVKAQNYLTSASLSSYALTSSLSSYALLSGATFTGNVSGLTAATADNSTLVATTAFVKAQNYITSSALSLYALTSSLSSYALTSSLASYALTSSLSSYALTSSLSSYALTSSLSSYALLSGGTFTGNVSGLTAATADNSTKFATTAFVKAQNYLSSATPTYSTTIVPTTNTLDNFQGNYWTQYSTRPTNSVTTLNGVTTVNIGLQFPYAGSPPSTSNIIISNTFYALGTVANPDTAWSDNRCLISTSYGPPPTNTTNVFNINMYNATTGARIKGYGTLLKSYSTNSYGIMFIATDGVVLAVNTPYTYDPFQFTYT
jgi:hypothetical protein